MAASPLTSFSSAGVPGPPLGIRFDADGRALERELELDEDCEGHGGLLWLGVPLHPRCPASGPLASGRTQISDRADPVKDQGGELALAPGSR